MSALFSWVLGFAARREEQTDAHGGAGRGGRGAPAGPERDRGTEMSALFSWVLGFAARREEQTAAHGVPGLASQTWARSSAATPSSTTRPGEPGRQAEEEAHCAPTRP